MLHICTACLFVRLEMRLHETTQEDLEMAVDTTRHYPLRDSCGLRVEVLKSSTGL
jgi:hypothetical protein